MLVHKQEFYKNRGRMKKKAFKNEREDYKKLIAKKSHSWYACEDFEWWRIMGTFYGVIVWSDMTACRWVTVKKWILNAGKLMEKSFKAVCRD